MMKKLTSTVLALFSFRTLSFAQVPVANFNPNDSMDIFSLSLEDLMNVKVTTASKFAQNASKVAATMMVITEDQINARGYQTLLDVMRDLPDFKVEENSSGQFNQITIRGIAGQDKFVIMLDGVRLSSPTNDMMPVFVNYPINLAKQIEVVYGPASALYGADAVSGIINIISKKADEDKNTTFKASSIAGNYNYTSSSLYINQKIKDDFNVTLSGQYLYDQQADLSKIYKNNPETNFDNSVYNNGYLQTDLKDSKGMNIPMKTPQPSYTTPAKGYNIYGSIRFRDFSFSAISTYTQNSSALGYKTRDALYNKDAFLGRTVNMLNMQHNKKVDNFTFTSLLMGSKYFTDPNSNYQNLYVGLNKGYKYDVGSMLKAEEQINWELNEKLTIIGGATAEMFNSIPKGGDLESPVDQSTSISGVYLGSRSVNNPDGIQAQLYNLAYTNMGTYLQAQYNPINDLSITLGGRYDKNSRFGSTVNPRASVVYSVSRKTTLKLLYNQAFLAPSPFIAYQHYGSFTPKDTLGTTIYTSSFWHLPNPKLKPIQSKNIELSVRQFIGNNFSVSVSSYITFLSDLVIRAGDVNNLYNGHFLGNKIGFIETFINQGKQTNYGGNIILNHSALFGKLKLNSYASVSYVNGTTDLNFNNQNRKVEIENVSPIIVRVGADVYFNKFSGSVRLINVGKQRINLFEDPTNPNARQTLDGYTMLNLSLKYKVYKATSVFVNVENALNLKYYNIASELNPNSPEVLRGAPQSPIRIAGGLQLSF